MSFIFGLLVAFAARAETLYLPCTELLTTGSGVALQRRTVTGMLKTHPHVWTAWESNEPDRDLVMVVGVQTSLPTLFGLAQEFIDAVGLDAFRPGEAAAQNFPTLEQIMDSVSPDRGAKLSLGLNRVPSIRPDFVDSITLLENPGYVKPELWASDDLKIFYADDDREYVRQKRSSYILGLRSSKRALGDWLAKPLALIGWRENRPYGAALPPEARARLRAIYLVTEPTDQATPF